MSDELPGRGDPAPSSDEPVIDALPIPGMPPSSPQARRPLEAEGEQVYVRPAQPADEPVYREAVTASAGRLAEFAVPDPHALPTMLANQGPTFRTFLVFAKYPAGGHGLVGKVNIANVVRGAFQSATMGYDGYDPYVGKGLFVEGLDLVIRLAFADEPLGLGLHRLEANVQTSNTRSAGVVRYLGFVHEGYSRSYLHLPGPDGKKAWRNHERYAVLRSDWPAAPFRTNAQRRLAAVITGRPSPNSEAVGKRIAVELGIPYLDASLLDPPALVWDLLHASPAGGIVQCNLTPIEVRIGLARAQFDPDLVPRVKPTERLDKRDLIDLALRIRATFA